MSQWMPRRTPDRIWECMPYIFDSRWFVGDYVRIVCQGGITRSEVICHYSFQNKELACIPCKWQFLQLITISYEVGWIQDSRFQANLLYHWPGFKIVIQEVSLESWIWSTSMHSIAISCQVGRIQDFMYVYIYNMFTVSYCIIYYICMCIWHINTHVRKSKRV